MTAQSTNIFVYGTLMFDDVWRRLVTGCYPRVPAQLHGYVRVCIQGESYPGIRISPEHSVNGVLYQDVNAGDLQRLDNFEGDYYQRSSISVATADVETKAAEVYLFHPQFHHLLSDTSWDCEYFRDHHLQHFIQHYANW